MGFDELRRRLADVVAIPVTPFDERGELDEPAHVKVVRRMADGGVRVLTPNGNTGEFYALTEPETRRALDLTVATAGDATTILAGVGHSTGDAVAAAKYAARAGAHAIMIHQPVHPYASSAGWIEYHRAIADAVPELGVVLYLRSTRIEGEHIARLGDASPNVVAVKYAVPDPVRFASVARDAGLDRFTWLAGLAELSAPGYWVAGATGFTSGLANVDPALSLRLLSALRAADYPEAMRVWERIRPFEALRAAGEAENNVSVVKEALAQLGVCRADIRPPSHLLDADGRAAVTSMLTDWALTSEAGK
jgi:4-hydroxy-tetrahydrodipicolinate synthase